MTDSTLKDKTTRSLFWSFVDKSGQQLINFAAMLVLMNVLSVEDYGLVASLAIFSAFSSILIDSGFGRALLNRKDISDADYSSVFYFNISLSIVLYLILFFSAPLLVSLFNAPTIVPVARVLFLSLIFNSLGLIHQTLLIKRADFKAIAKINNLVSLVVNLIAILLALTGYGVWALVIQNVLYALCRTICLWLYSSWRPVALFALQRLKLFFKFSNKLLLSSMISATINNIYPSIIAAYYPMNRVAFFNQAKKYQEIPFLTISNSYRSVSMLILSEINEQQKRLRRVVSKLIKSVAFLSFPIGLLMILVAEPIFFLFFREKWLPAVPYFQVLTFAGILSPFAFIFNELFISVERSTLFLGLEVVKGCLLIILIILFFSGGVMGLAVSWVVYTVIVLILAVILSRNVIDYSLTAFIKDTIPYFLTALVSAGITYIVTQFITNGLLFIVAGSLLYALLYLILCRLLRLEMTKEIDEWFAQLKKRRGE